MWAQWLSGHQRHTPYARHSVFITASATLKEQVAKALRKLQVRGGGGGIGCGVQAACRWVGVGGRGAHDARAGGEGCLMSGMEGVGVPDERYVCVWVLDERGGGEKWGRLMCGRGGGRA